MDELLDNNLIFVFVAETSSDMSGLKSEEYSERDEGDVDGDWSPNESALSGVDESRPRERVKLSRGESWFEF